MANLVTLFRFLLFFALVGSAYFAAPPWQLLNAPLIIVIIALDGLDGYLARRRGEVSSFGAVFDIAVDRVVETVLWVVLADLDLVPVWVPIVFITRGTIVDFIRAQQLATHGPTAFGAVRTPWGRFLVGSRFMRGLYG
ncbi:MAG: CDP-alcohol phosphatidyltransferase family protein, partial [Candidatus Binatia bacterium]